MNVQEAYTGLDLLRQDLFEILCQLCVEIAEWSAKEGLSPSDEAVEIKQHFKENKAYDYRKRFHIFTKKILTVSNNIQGKIRIYELPRTCNDHKGYWPKDQAIVNKINLVPQAAQTLIYLMNYKAHNEVDNGALLMFSAIVLRLRELVSDETYEKYETLWHKAAQIFSSDLNLADTYGVANENEDESENKKPEEQEVPSNDLLEATDGLTSQISEKTDGLARQLNGLTKQLKEQKNTQKLLLEMQRDIHATINDGLEKVESSIGRVEGQPENGNKLVEEQDLQNAEDDLPDITDMEISADVEVKINRRQASDRLLQLRNEIRGRWRNLKGWENILQSPFVEATVSTLPATREAWTAIPKIEQRYLEYQQQMDMQLDEYWERIIDILKKVEGFGES